MSQEDFNRGASTASTVLFIIFLIVLITLLSECDNSWKLDSVKHGKAEWITDPVTGHTRWEWKP